MSDAQRYPKQVFWSDEDEGFIALAPDLPGCSAFGETEQKALLEIQDAIEAWIGAAIAAGNPVPEPTRLKQEAQPSGRLLLRLPPSLHADLLKEAKREQTSLNQHIVLLLKEATVVGRMEAFIRATTLDYTQRGILWAGRFSSSRNIAVIASTRIDAVLIEPSSAKRQVSTTTEHLFSALEH